LFNEWRDKNGKLRSARSLKDFQDSTGMEQNSVLLSTLWSDKEEDFIDRAINPRINSRLACQCVISGDLQVVIPDQKQFYGH
jgi:hypothetical protein